MNEEVRKLAELAEHAARTAMVWQGDDEPWQTNRPRAHWYRLMSETFAKPRKQSVWQRIFRFVRNRHV